MPTLELTLHGRLRRATESAHLRVEQAFELDVMLADISAYGRALRHLYAALMLAEAALARRKDGGAAVNPEGLANRLNWLRADLQALDAQPMEVNDLRLELDSVGQVIGCHYVLEGSTLGGIVIARQAEQRLGVTPLRGARYFHGLGADTGDAWRRFLALLDTIPAKSVIADETEIGAAKTFALFEVVGRRQQGQPNA